MIHVDRWGHSNTQPQDSPCEPTALASVTLSLGTVKQAEFSTSENTVEAVVTKRLQMLFLQQPQGTDFWASAHTRWPGLACCFQSHLAPLGWCIHIRQDSAEWEESTLICSRPRKYAFSLGQAKPKANNKEAEVRNGKLKTAPCPGQLCFGLCLSSWTKGKKRNWFFKLLWADRGRRGAGKEMRLGTAKEERIEKDGENEKMRRQDPIYYCCCFAKNF